MSSSLRIYNSSFNLINFLFSLFFFFSLAHQVFLELLVKLPSLRVEDFTTLHFDVIIPVDLIFNFLVLS